MTPSLRIVVFLAIAAAGLHGCANAPVAPTVIATAPSPSPSQKPTAPVEAPGLKELMAAREASAKTRLGPPGGGSVTAENQMPLNRLAIPYASYLNAIHNKIHPRFSDQWLVGFDKLSKTAPENDETLATRLEIIVDAKGKIERAVVIRPSGVDTFDAAAVDSVTNAGPFPAPDSLLLSYDNRLYIHWDFYRDEVFACSTMHAHPYILSN